MNDEQRWIEHEGVTYIRELGIGRGQVIVDFGCNAGHYTLPAARVVGSRGKVYAIEQEQAVLDQLMKQAQNKGLNTIIPVISSEPVINLPDASVDIVFLYDVLHYLSIDDRKILYRSVNTVLKDNGILSVFPKHNQADCPMWHLENLTITEIIAEIGNNHFVLIDNMERTLIHDDNLEKGIILNFKKT